jgi:hypothetical protein
VGEEWKPFVISHWRHIPVRSDVDAALGCHMQDCRCVLETSEATHGIKVKLITSF